MRLNGGEWEQGYNRSTCACRANGSGIIFGMPGMADKAVGGGSSSSLLYTVLHTPSSERKRISSFRAGPLPRSPQSPRSSRRRGSPCAVWNSPGGLLSSPWLDRRLSSSPLAFAILRKLCARLCLSLLVDGLGGPTAAGLESRRCRCWTWDG